MAEIEIQRKRAGGPWGWVAGLVLVALLIWGVAEWMDDDADFAVAPAEEVLPLDAPYGVADTETGALESFRVWVRDSAQVVDMGRQHEYTREGIERMGAALEELARRNNMQTIDPQLQALAQHRQSIRTSAWASDQHANEARQAFIAAVDVLDRLQQRPELQDTKMQEHVQAARTSAQRLDANRPLLEQRTTVHEFFEHVAAALSAAEQNPS